MRLRRGDNEKNGQAKTETSEGAKKALLSLCEMSAVLWGKVNYKRRQSFFSGEIDWDTKNEYDEFKWVLGSATIQQIIRKTRSLEELL